MILKSQIKVRVRMPSVTEKLKLGYQLDRAGTHLKRGPSSIFFLYFGPLKGSDRQKTVLPKMLNTVFLKKLALPNGTKI